MRTQYLLKIANAGPTRVYCAAAVGQPLPVKQQWKQPVKPLVSKGQRPVNLDIGSMKLPITAYVSITHRLSGIFLFFASGLLIWALDLSLSSEQSFNDLALVMANPIAKGLMWTIATALSYHALSGVKHIAMDFGYGETMEGGVMGARIVIVLALVAAGLWGVAVW